MLPHSSFIHFVSITDWIVFFLVLLSTLTSVIWGQKLKHKSKIGKENSAIELLLMGRQLTLPLFVATLVATWYGGIFGVTTLTFEKGIYNFLTQGVFWYITYFIFAIFLVKRIRKYQVLTLPELAGEVIGPGAKPVTAVLNFLNLLPLAYTISLGLFLQALFGGSLILNSLIGVGLVTLWSLWGGFRAVVFSDVVQFFFMILGVFLVVVFSWIQFGSPLTLVDKLPPSHFDWKGGEPLSGIFIWGFIALSTLVDPSFYQRCLAAKDEAVARKGIIISIFIWFFFDCCTTLGALYARAILPSANPQNAYLQFILETLPSGVRGLVLAGILATILSTLDSFLFTAATCISYDLFKFKETFKVWHHHLALIGVALLTILLGSQFEGNIVEVWKTLGSFSAACLLFPLLSAQYYPGRISEKSFFWAVTLGCIGIVSWRILNRIYTFSSLDEFYVGLLVTSLVILPGWLRKKA